MRRIDIPFLLWFFSITGASTSSAQTLTTLFSFNGTDGEGPMTALLQSGSGYFWGTTTGGMDGGPFGGGTVYVLGPDSTVKTIYEFCKDGGNCTDGAYPTAALVESYEGDIYGTTVYGGSSGCDCGTVFKISPSGAFTTLHSFGSQAGDGEYPLASLVLLPSGELYGTTSGSGVNGSFGTVFRITPNGALTTIHAFTGADGSGPTYGSLVRGADGNLYGLTTFGGANNHGTAFKITALGTIVTLYSFCSLSGCADGATPVEGLVEGPDGNFYGTTQGPSSTRGDGAIFKMTPDGTLTVLYNFCLQGDGCTDGQDPTGLLFPASDGNLYGETGAGGAYGLGCNGEFGNTGCGTLFKITPSGMLTTLYTFCSPEGPCPDGYSPQGGLTQATNGFFLGTTYGGDTGTNASLGTIFSLADGLRPFVETHPGAGEVGARVKILGSQLTGATSVTFNGTPAAFTVNRSGTSISTVVPSGATTGNIQVVTPKGTLSTNVPFSVL